MMTVGRLYRQFVTRVNKQQQVHNHKSTKVYTHVAHGVHGWYRVNSNVDMTLITADDSYLGETISATNRSATDQTISATRHKV